MTNLISHETINQYHLYILCPIYNLLFKVYIKALQRPTPTDNPSPLHCSIINYPTQHTDLQQQYHQPNTTLHSTDPWMRTGSTPHSVVFAEDWYSFIVSAPEHTMPCNVEGGGCIHGDPSRLIGDFMLHWCRDEKSIDLLNWKWKSCRDGLQQNTAEAMANDVVKVICIKLQINLKLKKSALYPTHTQCGRDTTTTTKWLYCKISA